VELCINVSLKAKGGGGKAVWAYFIVEYSKILKLFLSLFIEIISHPTVSSSFCSNIPSTLKVNGNENGQNGGSN
jgi:hypothetical protein